MDIYEYLKLDHERVAHLFKQFNSSDSKVHKQQIMELIAQELIVHAESEQATFYKALEHHLKDESDVLHGRKEHKEIEEKIDKILHAKSFGGSWTRSVKKLQELVEHHVKEEEGAIFTKAKEVLSKEDAYKVKEKMHYLKQQLLKHIKKDIALAV